MFSRKYHFLFIVFILMVLGSSEVFAQGTRVHLYAEEYASLMEAKEINISEDLPIYLDQYYHDHKKLWYISVPLSLVGFGGSIYYTWDYWAYAIPFSLIDGASMYGLINSAYHEQNLYWELGIFFGSRVIQIGLGLMFMFFYNDNLKADLEDSFNTTFDVSYNYNTIYNENQMSLSIRF